MILVNIVNIYILKTVTWEKIVKIHFESHFQSDDFNSGQGLSKYHFVTLCINYAI